MAEYDSFQSALGGTYIYPYNLLYSQYLNDNAGVDMRINWFRPIFEGGTTNYCLKSVDWQRVSSSSNTPEYRGMIEGISLIRSVEMYYIVAEAYLNENNLTEAANISIWSLIQEGLQSSKRDSRQLNHLWSFFTMRDIKNFW